MMRIKIQPILLALLALSHCTTSCHAQGQQSYDDIRVALFQPNPVARSIETSQHSAEATAAKKAVLQKTDAKKPPSVTNFDIYRDYSPLPTDPRKPCNECVTRQTDECEKKCKFSCLTGFKGQPFRDREPGGCKCGKSCMSNKKRPFFSVYWPAVGNAIGEERNPEKAAQRAANLNRFRINNLFDCAGGFELLPYDRRDNGYCGKNRDRFGCLGESRYLQSNVAGVGYRLPGQPVARGGVEYP